MKSVAVDYQKIAKECQCTELPSKVRVTRARVYPNLRTCLLFLKYDAKGELVQAEITAPYDTSTEPKVRVLKHPDKKSDFLSLYRALIRHQIIPESIPKKGNGIAPTLEVIGTLVSLLPERDVETFRTLTPAIQTGSVMYVPLVTSRPMPMVQHWIPVDQHSELGMIELVDTDSKPFLNQWVNRLSNTATGYVIYTPEGSHGQELACFRVPNVQGEELCVVKKVDFTLTVARTLKPVLTVSTKSTRAVSRIPLPHYLMLRNHHIKVGTVISLRRNDRGGLVYHETVAEEGMTPLPLCPHCHSGSVLRGSSNDVYCNNDSCRGLAIVRLRYILNNKLDVKYLSDNKVTALINDKQDLFSLLKTPTHLLRHRAGFGARTVDALEEKLNTIAGLPLHTLAEMSCAFYNVGVPPLDEMVFKKIFSVMSIDYLKALPSTGKMYSQLLDIEGIRNNRAVAFLAGWPAFQQWMIDLNAALQSRSAISSTVNNPKQIRGVK
ncbi:hypothetical protein Amme1_00189 [Pseudomonas phage vB_PpuM-Amme-1]